MYIVEVVGVPGSGKSTLCAQLAAVNSRRRVAPISFLLPDQLIIRSISERSRTKSCVRRATKRLVSKILEHKHTSLLSGRAYASAIDVYGKEYSKEWSTLLNGYRSTVLSHGVEVSTFDLYWLLKAFAVVCAVWETNKAVDLRQPTLLLHDEGFGQRMLGLGRKGLAREQVRELSRKLPVPDLLLKVECNEAISLERFRKREFLRGGLLTSEREILAYQRGHRDVLENYQADIEALGVPTVTVDTSKTNTTQAVAMVCSQFRRFIDENVEPKYVKVRGSRVR